MGIPTDPKPGSQPVAQDDVLGEAAANSGSVRGIDTPTVPPPAGPPQGEGEAPPGKDENQAGFLKDKDKRFSP